MPRISLYYSAMGFAGLLGLAKSVVYAMMLGPSEFGDLNLILVAAAFIVYIMSGGLLEGIALRLPVLYGQAKASTAVALAQHATLVFLFYSVLAVAGLTFFCVLLWPSGITLVLALLVASSTGILSILLSDSRSSGSLSAFGAFSLARVGLVFTLGVPGGLVGGVPGVVAGELLGQAFLAVWVFLSLKRRWASSDVDAIPALSELRKEGKPLLIHNLFQVVQQNLDRVLVFVGLGSTALGQYGFAALLMMAASLLHAMLYQLVGPAALREKEEGAPIEEIFRRTRVVAFRAAALMLLVGILAWGGWHLLAPSLLESYSAALEILPLLAVAAALHVAQLFDWIIAGENRIHTLAKVSGIVTVLHALFGLLGVLFGMPLWFYAMLTLVNRISTVIIGVFLAGLAISQSPVPEFQESKTKIGTQE